MKTEKEKFQEVGDEIDRFCREKLGDAWDGGEPKPAPKEAKFWIAYTDVTITPEITSYKNPIVTDLDEYSPDNPHTGRDIPYEEDIYALNGKIWMYASRGYPTREEAEEALKKAPVEKFRRGYPHYSEGYVDCKGNVRYTDDYHKLRAWKSSPQDFWGTACEDQARAAWQDDRAPQACFRLPYYREARND